jgi:hypothetical protein
MIMIVNNIDLLQDCNFPQFIVLIILFFIGGPFIVISSLLETLLEELYSRWWNKPS